MPFSLFWIWKERTTGTSKIILINWPYINNQVCEIDIMRCNTCGLEENIPFRCNYCRQSFCHLHRIPINHSCPYVDKYAEKRRHMIDGNYDGNVPVSNNIGRALLRAIRIKSFKNRSVTPVCCYTLSYRCWIII